MHNKKERSSKLDNKGRKLAVGTLLHDVGKLLYRANDGRNHSQSGFEFLKAQGIDDAEILNQVRFHHGKMLAKAQLKKDDLAYIAYWADNVAAGADRRENDERSEWGYDRYVPLSSIFNRLNGNSENYTYDMQRIYDNGKANNPKHDGGTYSEGIYNGIIEDLKQCISAIELTDAYVNSLLGVLEATQSFVPSSTDKSQLCDISLYDHSKIAAAIAGCIYEYLNENHIDDYQEVMLKKAKETYEKKAFLMVSLDISGIQNFIYTVGSSQVLKTLRAKSFYLEIMLEHIVDELLERVGLSRANLIYSGGGHAYLLFANTQKTLDAVIELKNELNQWFLKWFKTDLYMAVGTAKCSANDLMNDSAGSYEEIFKEVGRSISESKANRYSVSEVMALNKRIAGQYERECKVCGELDFLNEESLCRMCASFISASSDILNKDFITIINEKVDEKALMLPFGRYMILETEEEIRNRIKQKSASYVRCYSKNRMFTGYNVATKLWVGDYHEGNSFHDFVDKAEGIQRIGVLRAYVDNLGQAFVKGFNQNYTSLSRTATFSRKMSLFFKLHINDILKNGKYSLLDSDGMQKNRNAAIIYSGGDDIFLIGAWDDVICASIDLNDSLQAFTQGTLTMSAGIGIFPEKYPANALARQTGELEELAKGLDGKNAVTLFSEESVFHWDDFKNHVLGEKFQIIKRYFDGNEEKGASAMYKMLGYIRNREEKINLARFAYMLGRIEPEKKDSEEKKLLYQEFSKKMYQWIKNEEDSKELITAIYLYVYLNRNKEEKHAGINKN